MLSFLFYKMPIEMDLDIDMQIAKLNAIVDDKKIPPFKNYRAFRTHTICNEINYLLYILELTYDHSEIESYLKGLLKNYSVAKLNVWHFTVLHHMIQNLSCISLGSFEIIIKFGVGVNSQSSLGNTPLHLILYRAGSYELQKHIENIIALFIKYGADLNILNYEKRTVLDNIAQQRLDKYLENIIMTLIDFGAKSNNTLLGAKTQTINFIETYRSSNIKPAIKNEI